MNDLLNLLNLANRADDARADLTGTHADVAGLVDRARALLVRAAGKLAREQWHREEGAADRRHVLALDASDDAPAVLPLPVAKRVRRGPGSGNGHTRA